MSEGNSLDITLAGAGKVASQLGVALAGKGFRILSVYSRTTERGKRLARRLGAAYVADPRELDPGAGLCLVAVSDAAIRQVALQLPPMKGIVAHTSGTLERSALDGVAGKTGVFYPLQTFAATRRVDFSHLPICIEGSSPAVTRRLTDIARSLTTKIFYPDHRQRQILHLGAVIASNFSNYLYAVAEDLLRQNGLDFDILRPLIRQTALNARRYDIFKYQTGPAIRGDQQVIDRHRELLKGDPELLDLYNTLTNNIINHANHHGKL